MASMASPCIRCYIQENYSKKLFVSSPYRILAQQQQPEKSTDQVGRSLEVRGALIKRGMRIGLEGCGKKPDYLGVQKNPPGLALCPATNNCVSTSESTGDLNHYAPPWNYNPEGGRGSKKPVDKEAAMQELVEVIKSTKPDNFTPRMVEKTDDYLRVEYESPILGFVDDVEFWFPPGKKSLVQYRSASRTGSFDFDANRKRIKALRLKLEKRGWASEDGL